MVVVAALLAYAVVASEVITAAWSLVAREPWAWDRFWLFFIAIGMAGVASQVAESLVGGKSPETQRTAAEEDEVAQAIRTGQLPKDADPDWWCARIRQERRTAAVFVVCSTVTCLAAAALAFAAARWNNDGDPGLSILTVATLLSVIPLLSVWVLIRRKEGRLLAQL